MFNKITLGYDAVNTYNLFFDEFINKNEKLKALEMIDVLNQYFRLDIIDIFLNHHHHLSYLQHLHTEILRMLDIIDCN